MDISSVSNYSVLDIYAKGVKQEMDQAEKLAKIQIELQMKEEQFEMAEKALLDFYA